MNKDFLKKHTKELIIGASIIIAAIIFVVFNRSCSSSKDHCYYKVYKVEKSRGKSDSRAAILARYKCE